MLTSFRKMNASHMVLLSFLKVGAWTQNYIASGKAVCCFLVVDLCLLVCDIHVFQKLNGGKPQIMDFPGSHHIVSILPSLLTSN